MRTRRRMTGFTLVEILIVVVILGILAAIVIPQFTSASQEAVKGALQSQLQTIESQFELFRVRNQGAIPDAAAPDNWLNAGENDGWGILVSEDYLKEQPVNGYIGAQDIVAAAGVTPNIAAGNPPAGTSGWGFRAADPGPPAIPNAIFAFGYDPINNLLSNETGVSPTTGNPYGQHILVSEIP